MPQTYSSLLCSFASWLLQFSQSCRSGCPQYFFSKLQKVNWQRCSPCRERFQKTKQKKTDHISPHLASVSNGCPHWFTNTIQTHFSVLQLPQLTRPLLATSLTELFNLKPFTNQAASYALLQESHDVIWNHEIKVASTGRERNVGTAKTKRNGLSARKKTWQRIYLTSWEEPVLWSFSFSLFCAIQIFTSEMQVFIVKTVTRLYLIKTDGTGVKYLCGISKSPESAAQGWDSFNQRAVINLTYTI